MKTIVIGVGNPICSDDGVGIVVAKRLAERMCAEFAESVGGFEILNEILGYDRAIIVDSIRAGEVGEVYKIEMEPSEPSLSHSVGIFEVVETANRAGLHLPEIEIYGVGVKDGSFGEVLSIPEEKIEEAVTKIADEARDS
jgi:hydrogenase maturation protease